MGLSKQKRRISKRERIRRYTKPFTKRLPALTATNDKRYIPSGRSNENEECSHDYCLAERGRLFMDSDDVQKPVGLPWASGKLKYLPGHVKVVFPLRKNEKKIPEKSKKSFTPRVSQTLSGADKINNPEMCGAIDELLYAYKVFMLGGMIISEAKKLSGEYNEEKEDESDDDDDDGGGGGKDNKDKDPS